MNQERAMTAELKGRGHQVKAAVVTAAELMALPTEPP